ncbi:MAG TPA: type III pantothenate kinase [Spirochaetota bacterium]|nr:type III pantothenate kinase [Spirochaetota bacterium]HPP05587.1 type III pantothenate kinase [Spirochaetota bacterium]
MLLCLDIGNTNIEFGIFTDRKNDFDIIASFRFFTHINITDDEIGLFVMNYLNIENINPSKIDKMIYSSVVPPINDKIEKMFNKYFKGKMIEVNEKTKLGIVNKYKNPREVGSDRLVNATAVYHIYKKNAIIVDMGTATTICAITEKGEYLGGTIFPGIQTATNALREKAARLPAINIQKRDRILSDDTASAIESGVFFSNLFALKGMMDLLAKEVNFNEYIKIGTGGYTSIFKDSGIFDIYDESLSLKGLKIISDLNN